MSRLEQYENQQYFNFNGQPYRIRQTGSLAIAEGVICDLYMAQDTDELSVGILHIDADCETPLQRMHSGYKTIEGIIHGSGELAHRRYGTDRDEILYVDAEADDSFFRVAYVEDDMQWRADNDEPLTIYQVCWPPYQEGRFEYPEIEAATMAS